MSASSYVELHARSAFSFLRGTAQPEALAAQAAALELDTVAVCDRMGLYGTPRFRTAARAQGLHDVVGAELLLEDGSVLPVLVQDRTGYQNLCQLLTRAHLRAEKGEGCVKWAELPEFAPGLVALTGGEEGPLLCSLLERSPAGDRFTTAPEFVLKQLTQAFGPARVYVEIQRHCRPEEARWNRRLIDLATHTRLPLLATNGVEHLAPEDRAVADVFTCLRAHTHLDQAGDRLSVNAERHLKSPAAMAVLFRDLPAAITQTRRLSEQLQFQLTDLGYEFPAYPVGAGETMPGVLLEWVRLGAARRYPAGVPARVAALLRKELALIEELGFAGYFLIVADLIRFCRENDILAQGRGSAANSAVCYCLGITAVDPVKFNVLFERFLSASRKGWPDIDIDLPSGERREAVIQEVYRRYGPHGAAMTGAVHTYRGRGTAREVGKVLNLPANVLERFSHLFGDGGEHPPTLDMSAQLQQAGLAAHPRAQAFATLYPRIAGLPRHLGQHSGGMIICQGGLHRFVPLENAAMPGRVVAQWDKDDCADLGIIKVDLLGLGMMAALQEAVTLSCSRGRPVDLAQLPENDGPTFDLLCRADTIGVFQVESRAQMATLPRMQPRCFYDLVVEVAIIRPGPIQGDLAHPYLRRRTGEEAITYYDPRVIPILQRTLGVPLFQEQMLQIAMEMADFSGSEAEDLRKALSFHRSDERMVRAAARLRAAMLERGVPPDVGERIAQAVGSFALYGFPESHAISFALLAYASAYLKVHRAPEFYAALLNNQPMGFYSAATLLQDARRHGVVIRPVCAARSEWRCTLADDHSLRLGLMQVEGLRRTAADTLLAERARAPFTSLNDFLARTTLDASERRTLANIGALNVWAEHRRAALWDAGRPLRQGDLFEGFPEAPAGGGETPRAPLARMSAAERLQADYAGQRLSTGPHPLALLRARVPTAFWRAADLPEARGGVRIRVAGQVICRQRPGTAKGVCFVSLEDETGIINAIVAPDLFEATRLLLISEPFLIIEGIVQLRHRTIHIQARSLERLDYAGLTTAASHDFA